MQSIVLKLGLVRLVPGNVCVPETGCGSCLRTAALSHQETVRLQGAARSSISIGNARRLQQVIIRLQLLQHEVRDVGT